jgi:hypothetical protein
MAPLIVLIGAFLILVGMAVLIVPQSMRKTLEVFLDRRWVPAASLIRIVLGLVCILGAAETHLPTFVLGFGVLVLIAGIAIPFVGFERIERLVHFWIRQSDAVLRLWSVAVIGLGSVLVWSAV